MWSFIRKVFFVQNANCTISIFIWFASWIWNEQHASEVTVMPNYYRTFKLTNRVILSINAFECKTGSLVLKNLVNTILVLAAQMSFDEQVMVLQSEMSRRIKEAFTSLSQSSACDYSAIKVCAIVACHVRYKFVLNRPCGMSLERRKVNGSFAESRSGVRGIRV